MGRYGPLPAMVFISHGEYYAIDSAYVLGGLEDVGVGDVTPVPGAPDHILGFVDSAGQRVPALSLRTSVDRAPRRGDATGETLVLTLRVSGEKVVLVLVVDSLDECMEIDVEESTTDTFTVDPTLICGYFEHGAGTGALVDPRMIWSLETQFAFWNAVRGG